MVRSSDAVERWGQGWGSVCWQGQWVAQAKLAKPVGRVLPRNLMFSVWDPHLQKTDRFFHGPGGSSRAAGRSGPLLGPGLGLRVQSGRQSIAKQRGTTDVRTFMIFAGSCSGS
jgi:hypothetical protein